LSTVTYRSGWARQVDQSTLVVVDEAGMADTLSLDAAVAFVLERGGSVRLIGDDQQLAAIGAGGVLRDIRASHGAVHLSELLRFADPAEGAASLALREGRPEALGFYLDKQRVHVGDLTTMTEDVFGAWQADRSRGLDSIMLAPTRELAGELNRRARAHRLAGSGPSGVVRLADGNEASAGDLLITRANDRRLRTSATDWVKNGDRWTLLAIGRRGDLSVQHTRNGRTVRLPADYVQASTELGYATTVHCAQGVSVDTMHGLVSGAEARQRHLSPAVAERVDRDHALAAPWAPRLRQLVGTQRAEALQASPWWPALVTAVDHGLQRGWRLEDLLATDTVGPVHGEDDECQAMTWRVSVLTDPSPATETHDPLLDDGPPDDMWNCVEPPDDAIPADELTRRPFPAATPYEHAPTTPPDDPAAVGGELSVESELILAGMLRNVLGPPEPTDADIARLGERAFAWEQSPVGRDRMLEVNQLALRYFQDQYPHSWGRRYLAERLGTDLHGDPRYRPGQAPAGWTGLVQHLRRHGVTDTEMLTAGVATTASTGRLIDRFRDRVVFPITHRGEVLGFVGRRHPDLTDADRRGPKYLNTAETPLFHKGAQLFGAVEEHLADGAVPVAVEGALDAVAVTIATGGSHVGVAPLGTSLTDEQAAQLGRLGADAIVATDADLAGRVAAERAYWLLTPHGLDPTYARFPTGSDPADLLALRGPHALRQALAAARPLADVLIDERLANLAPGRARSEAARVVAARPFAHWEAGTDRIGARLRVPTALVRGDLLSFVQEWNRDPRKATHAPLQNLGAVRARLVAAANQSPHQRWSHLAHAIDPRLIRQGDWPALASLLQDAHDRGHDVTAAVRRLVAESPLNDLPAQDLRYRLVSPLDGDSDDPGAAPRTSQSTTPSGAQERRHQPATLPRPTSPRR
jgi:DNA primase catalytic core